MHYREIADAEHRRDRPDLYERPIEDYEIEPPPRNRFLARLWWPAVIVLGAALAVPFWI